MVIVDLKSHIVKILIKPNNLMSYSGQQILILVLNEMMVTTVTAPGVNQLFIIIMYLNKAVLFHSLLQSPARSPILFAIVVGRHISSDDDDDINALISHIPKCCE